MTRNPHSKARQAPALYRPHHLVLRPVQTARVWWRERQREQAIRAVQEAAEQLDSLDEARKMAFTFSLIALAARMGRIAGAARHDAVAVQREVFIAFCAEFPLPTTAHKKTRSLYDAALKDDVELGHYVRRIRRLFPERKSRDFLRDVLTRLCRVAMADGTLTQAKRELLREVAVGFGFGRLTLFRIVREQANAANLNPYRLLEVRADWTDGEIRRSYHRQIQQCHPDRVQAEGGCAEAMEVAERRMAMLGTAYHAIRKERHVP